MATAWYKKEVNRRGVVNRKIDHAKVVEYLNSTDWYVVRFAETGKAVPVDVTDKRTEARVVLNG